MDDAELQQLLERVRLLIDHPDAAGLDQTDHRRQLAQTVKRLCEAADELQRANKLLQGRLSRKPSEPSHLDTLRKWAQAHNIDLDEPADTPSPSDP